MANRFSKKELTKIKIEMQHKELQIEKSRLSSRLFSVFNEY